MSKNLINSSHIKIVTSGDDISLDFNEEYYTKGETDEILNNKMNIEAGKGLSTNDFSNNYKEKLNGIENEAQKNIIETIKLDGTALTPSSKAINIDLSGKANINDVYNKTDSDNRYVKNDDYVHTDNNFSNDYKEKIDSINLKTIEENNDSIKDVSNRTNRIEDNLFNSGIESGNSINIKDSVLAEFKKVEIDGEKSQETTEDDEITPGNSKTIKVIEDNFNLVSCSENIFNPFIITANPKIVVGDDGTIAVTGAEGPNGYIDTEKTFKQLCPSANVGDIVFLYGITDFCENNKSSFKEIIYLNKSITNWKFGTSKTITKEMLESNVIVYGGYNETSHIKLALSKDKIMSSYETHVNTTSLITVPENEFIAKINDNIKDKFIIEYNVQDAKYHLYLEKNIKKVILNGTENWNIPTRNRSTFVLNTFTDKKSGANNFICDKFSYKGNAQSQDLGYAMSFNIADYKEHIYIQVPSDVVPIGDVSTFKTWLAANPTTVYYELETPEIIDLGVIDMPLSYYSVTNVYTTCELQPNIEVEYYRDFKNTINTMQDNIELLESDVAELKEQVAQLMSSTPTMNFVEEESEVVEQ